MEKLIEVRFHGRAGQGMVTASEVLARAVNFEGKYSQAFPIFGSEKRGPPVVAFCRIDSKPIIIHEEVTEPNFVVVADSGVLKSVDVSMGLKPNGFVLVNTNKKPQDLGLKAKQVFVIDGTEIALKNFGKPIVNTVMLGAFVKLTGIVKLESVLKALRAKFEGKFNEQIIEANIKTIKESFEKMQGVKVAYTSV